MDTVLNAEERRAIEGRLGYRFRSCVLLDQALTHASFANEAGLPATGHYDRLEFLGDAVIGLVLAEHEYRAAPDLPSGTLSQRRASLARRPSLAAAGHRLDLGAAARLSTGERGHGGAFRRRLLADLFEAVTGAIYLDGGIVAVREFLGRALIGAEEAPASMKDFKSALQEIVQASGRSAPSYRVVEQSGPPHDPSFMVEVAIDGSRAGQGVGGSKREAEQAAARVAILSLARAQGRSGPGEAV